ncbi:MAG: hypothetical protein DYG89_40820 [Caldilinea sp. CFX5]|nr:hypothetical protein [Caldilinea sp. CFX5]
MLALISWLDLEYTNGSRVSFAQQLLARAVVAVGYRLYEKDNARTIALTIAAAERFALAPTAENFASYQAAATNSYPFGAGDGCYAIAETGYPGCEVGSGCRSGSGCLYLSGMDEIFVIEAIRKELLPWLQE